VLRKEDLFLRGFLRADKLCHPDEFKGVPLDWEYIFSRGKKEGVLPLVYQALVDADIYKAKVNDKILQRLQSHYYAVASRNLILQERLSVVLNTFNKNGLEVIVVKGIALIEDIYTNIALRPIFDIDILIRKKEFALAQRLLRDSGYVNSAHYPEDFYKDSIMVDVHWGLINTTRIKSRQRVHQIDMQDVWRDSLPFEIKGQKARRLSPEHTLMQLCLHLALHHGLQGLIWFADISRLIGYYEKNLNWQSFIENSIKYRITKPVYYTLRLVKDITGEDIPDFVFTGLKPYRQSFWEKKIFNIILSGRPLKEVRFFFTLASLEGLSNKLTFLREILLPSPSVLSARYSLNNNAFLPRYYALHLSSFLSSLLQLVSKN
jgi:hypothetical protein